MSEDRKSRTTEVPDFYRDNPGMVSSPFGGIEKFDLSLWEEVVEKLHLDFKGRTVLAVGCGRGLLAKYFRNNASQYIGVDLVRSAGREDFPFTLTNGACLPFQDNSFDVLLCIDALEHFPDIEKAAGEFHRVLNCKGSVFLSVPNYANVSGVVKKLMECLGRYEKDTWAPFGRWQAQAQEKFVTPRRITKAFQSAGFETMTYVGHEREVILGLFPWVDHPKAPEAARLRLHSSFPKGRRILARILPTLSSHLFWRIDC